MYRINLNSDKKSADTRVLQEYVKKNDDKYTVFYSGLRRYRYRLGLYLVFTNKIFNICSEKGRIFLSQESLRATRRQPLLWCF